jgi:hypothetical protein
MRNLTVPSIAKKARSKRERCFSQSQPVSPHPKAQRLTKQQEEESEDLEAAILKQKLKLLQNKRNYANQKIMEDLIKAKAKLDEQNGPNRN